MPGQAHHAALQSERDLEAQTKHLVQSCSFPCTVSLDLQLSSAISPQCQQLTLQMMERRWLEAAQSLKAADT